MEQDMSTENADLPAGGLFGQIQQELTSAINKGFAALESENSKIHKAFFDALTMPQRDVFCQSLQARNVKPSRLETITGKSAATVNRHLNGKHS
jgi:hypothetical protein